MKDLMTFFCLSPVRAIMRPGVKKASVFHVACATIAK